MAFDILGRQHFPLWFRIDSVDNTGRTNGIIPVIMLSNVHQRSCYRFRTKICMCNICVITCIYVSRRSSCQTSMQSDDMLASNKYIAEKCCFL